MRNLYVRFLSATFMTDLFAKRLCRTCLWNLVAFICGSLELVRVEPLCGTLGNLTFYVEPECGTLGNLTLFVEPEPLRVGPVCGTLGDLNFLEWNLLWNFGEPELLRVEPLCETLGNLTLYERNR